MKRVLDVTAVTFAVSTPKGAVDVTFNRKQIVVLHGGETKKMKRDPSDTVLPNQTRAVKVVANFLQERMRKAARSGRA